MNFCDPISKIISYSNGSTIFLSGIDPYISNVNLFKQFNIKVIISLLSNTPIPDMNKFGYQHHYFYLQDSPNADLFEIMNQTYPIILNSISNGFNVLIHCKAGISRSVSILCGFFIKCVCCYPNLVQIPKTHPSWTDSILVFIRSKRSCINPNKGFLSQLGKLETLCVC